MILAPCKPSRLGLGGGFGGEIRAFWKMYFNISAVHSPGSPPIQSTFEDIVDGI